jgi:hypothetical protein
MSGFEKSNYIPAGKPEKAEGVYESKPGYKVTYAKEKYRGSNSIVNMDDIGSLIGDSRSMAMSVKKMADNEEVKQVIQSDNYQNEPEDNFGYQNNQQPAENPPQEPTGLAIGDNERVPLEDKTNTGKKKKLYEFRNPITGDYEVDNFEKQNEKPTKKVVRKPKPKPENEDSTEETPDYDELIKQKERELNEVMERLSVSSRQSGRPPVEAEIEKPKVKPKPDVVNFPPPQAAERIERKPVTYAPPPPAAERIEKKPVSYAPPGAVGKAKDDDEVKVFHGHPSFPEYNRRETYTAKGMRHKQFHSGAPWATNN